MMYTDHQGAVRNTAGVSDEVLAAGWQQSVMEVLLDPMGPEKSWTAAGWWR